MTDVRRRRSVRSGGIDLSSVELLARALRRRDISAVEVARAALDALSTSGARLNAVAALMDKRALREARRADRAIRAGNAGPLCGIPYGVKDVISAAGAPTRWGSPTRATSGVEPDAWVVRRLALAGAVLVAKLSTISLAGAGGYRWSNASIHGPGRNPWDASRFSGGSSTGPAIAVAAGLLPFALATETGASICGPAALCGVTGLRPSRGRVEVTGVMPLAWTMDTVGAMACDAAGCHRVFRAIRSPGLPKDRDRAGTHRWRNVRSGILPVDFERHPAVAGPFAAALSVLSGLGMRAREVTLPESELVTVYTTLLRGETAASHGVLVRDGRVELLADPVQREGLRRAVELPVAEYVAASQQRDGLTHTVRQLFEKVDVVITPTSRTEAPLLDAELDRWRVHHAHTVVGAVTGVAAMNVPMGFGPNGLPVGMMLLGDRGSELTLLALAQEFQGVTGWHSFRPANDGPNLRRA